MKKITLLALMGFSLNLSAEVFRVGSMSGRESAMVHTAAKIAKNRYGLDVQVIEFDDYVMPNVALADKSIDANAIQHKPYLDAMVKDRGLDLVSVANTFVYPIGAYSKKIKKISELKDGMSIAIPADPSNGARALILLDKRGYIKLKDNTNLRASVLDIVENPHNYKFSEVEAAQLPSVLPDVDLAFINNNYAINANLIPTRHALIIEDLDSPYVNIIAVRAEDKDKEEVKAFIKAYQTPEVQSVADKIFKGGAVKGW